MSNSSSCLVILFSLLAFIAIKFMSIGFLGFLWPFEPFENVDLGLGLGFEPDFMISYMRQIDIRNDLNVMEYFYNVILNKF